MAMLFEFLQDQHPRVPGLWQKSVHQPEPTFRQNQFGGSIGGRIIKDKLFFFADTQLNRESQGGSLITSVPSAQNRTGNLSDWLAASPNYQIYDPATGNQTTGVGRQPFPEQRDPHEPLEPAGAGVLTYFPLPNTNAVRRRATKTTTLPAALWPSPATCGTPAGTTT